MCSDAVPATCSAGRQGRFITPAWQQRREESGAVRVGSALHLGGVRGVATRGRWGQGSHVGGRGRQGWQGRPGGGSGYTRDPVRLQEGGSEGIAGEAGKDPDVKAGWGAWASRGGKAGWRVGSWRVGPGGAGKAGRRVDRCAGRLSVVGRRAAAPNARRTRCAMQQVGFNLCRLPVSSPVGGIHEEADLDACAAAGGRRTARATGIADERGRHHLRTDVHLNVSDIEVQKLWIDIFGGVWVQKGPLMTVKFPNMLIAFQARKPEGPSQGTVMDHFRIRVKSMPDMPLPAMTGYTVTPGIHRGGRVSRTPVQRTDGLRRGCRKTRHSVPGDSQSHIHFWTPEYGCSTGMSSTFSLTTA